MMARSFKEGVITESSRRIDTNSKGRKGTKAQLTSITSLVDLEQLLVICEEKIAT